MNLLAHLLRVLAVASLGLYVGAMVTEGFVLVPYWRSLPPGEFLAWYAANDRRLVDFFGPLTIVAALLPAAAAAVSVRERHPRRSPAVVAAVLIAVVVSMFFLYFQQANASFAAATIRADGVPAELARWAWWHWVRTAVSVAALAAACLSVTVAER